MKAVRSDSYSPRLRVARSLGRSRVAGAKECRIDDPKQLFWIRPR